MSRITNTIARYRRELQAKLPDREIYMRTEGRMRYLKISSQFQVNFLLAASGLVAFTLVVLATTAIISISIASERDQLSEHAETLRDSEKRIDRYRSSVADFAAELTRRQQRLESMVQRRFGKLDKDGQEPAKPTAMQSNLPPEAAALAQAEQAQIVFARALADSIDERTASAEHALRKVGLRVPGARRDAAMGGPFIPVDSADEDFDALGSSLARFDRVKRVLMSTPSRLPALPAALTSNFGVRSDPFNRRKAVHAGLDIRGRQGQGIFAAADGRVVRVGRLGGYGNIVILSHGQGFETRYGHLSGFEVKPGTVVRAGQKIARMGSTGRSTGTHLHFEVRINGRAVNPLPYLSNASRTDQAKRALGRPGLAA